MRDLTFYPTLNGYRESIRSRFHWKFRQNRFYSNLIDYIVDTRAPIFYEISHPSEHFAFSGAYHFETRRAKYENIFRLNLFWLHDFTHMLFPYAWDVYKVSEYDFVDQFIHQERIASTETELFAYYRMPTLRQEVFPDEKLYYDVIRERGWWGHEIYIKSSGRRLRPVLGPGNIKPDAYRFLAHRNNLVNDDGYGEAELGEYPEILGFFQQWRRLTPQWVSERYKSVVGKRIPETGREFHTVTTYEHFIEKYEPTLTGKAAQERYERVTLQNVQRAYAMLGWDDPPTRWRHVPEALHSLEGAVFFLQSGT